MPRNTYRRSTTSKRPTGWLNSDWKRDTRIDAEGNRASTWRAFSRSAGMDQAAAHRACETARVRSIKAHAAGTIPPPGFSDPAKIPIGVEHFAAHCAVCHGAPGVQKGDIAHGLYPPPPDLAVTAKSYSAGELFRIIKHGIKMTGMPAWSDHSDEELWATVAFVQKLPGMTPEEYAKLVMASMAQGSKHHHEGNAGQPQDHNVHQH
jgi:mono/diheme cytochrome c family protein